MRRRILLADDSVTIQKVIELTFMDEDYEVRAVSNGDEAIQALSEVDPDIVIADVHMPGANGYDVCRSSKERRPDIPVLLLVGTFEPFDEAQARSVGADSFLKKPFDSQELLQRVAELLNAQTAAAPPEAAAPAAPTPPVFESVESVEAVDLAGTVRLSALSSMPELDFPAAAPVAPAAPVAEEPWGGFQLEPEEPRSGGATGFSEFALEEEPVPSWQTASPLPAGETMFELEEETPAAPAPPAPMPSGGDVFGFDSEPAEPMAPMAPMTPMAPMAPISAAPFEALPSLDDLPAPAASFSAPEPPVAAEAVFSEPPAAAAPPPAPAAVQAETNGALRDADVDRIARRVVELLGDKAVRDVAWEVIPDLAEVVIRDRLRELESQVETLE